MKILKLMKKEKHVYLRLLGLYRFLNPPKYVSRFRERLYLFSINYLTKYFYFNKHSMLTYIIQTLFLLNTTSTFKDFFVQSPKN